MSTVADVAIAVDKPIRLTARLATLILFMEGFVSVSVQMLALRQIVPFVGYSIAVTSIVITIFLAALAYGYRSGGRIEFGHERKLALNLLVIAGLVGFGLSFVAASSFFSIYYELASSPLLAVAMYSALFVAPLVYLLAQTEVDPSVETIIQ